MGETAHQLLAGVVQGGTGKSAQIGEFAAGKTGTTENYGDAWFVGFNKELTVAVWVGYPDELRYMKTEYGGSPVAGGTYPAGIWQNFMLRWIDIRERRDAENGEEDEDEQTTPVPAAPSTPVAPESEGPEPQEEKDDFQVPEKPRRETAEPQAPAEQEEPAPAPAQPAPQQPATPVPPAGGGATPPTGCRRPRLAQVPAEGGPHHGGPGARHAPARRVAEAPGELDRLRDPDARAAEPLRRGASRIARQR